MGETKHLQPSQVSCSPVLRKKQLTLGNENHFGKKKNVKCKNCKKIGKTQKCLPISSQAR